MKTFAVIAMCWFLLYLTACAGDVGTGVGSTDAGSSAAQAVQTFPGGDCYTMDSDSCLAFKATNMQRALNDMGPLAFCQACYEMAKEQSQDMYVRGYFDHTRPDETFPHRAARFGISKGAGENIAWGKLGAVVVDMWMNSPGHRANILNTSFKSFAVGTYGLYTTQVFYVGTDK